MTKFVVSLAAMVVSFSVTSFADSGVWNSDAVFQEIASHRIMFGRLEADAFGNFSQQEVERLAPLLATTLAQVPSKSALAARNRTFAVTILKGEKFSRTIYESKAKANGHAQTEYVLTIPKDALVYDLVSFFRENLQLESEPARYTAYVDGCTAHLAQLMPVL